LIEAYRDQARNETRRDGRLAPQCRLLFIVSVAINPPASFAGAVVVPGAEPVGGGPDDFPRGGFCPAGYDARFKKIGSPRLSA
jgi:hypothetical protein